MSPEAILGLVTVVVGAVISGGVSLAGVVFVARSNERNSAFEATVKAFTAVTTENQRLRDDLAQKERRIGELEAQLARAYTSQHPNWGPGGAPAAG